VPKAEPLGVPVDVLGTTRVVVDAARDVHIDCDAMQGLAARLAEQPPERPKWRVWPHWWSDSPHTATYVLVLDALNFSFWGEPRWRVRYEGRTFDGYWALAAALRRALDEGVPLLDADWLTALERETVATLLQGDSSVPLLDERTGCLREVGFALRRDFAGSFENAVARCEGSAATLVELVAHHFPSFDDRARYAGVEVHFFKRAQILVSDLVGAYDGRGLGAFGDLHYLTAFADYKVPQVLREEGLLVYSPALAAHVDGRREIPAGDPREVEIRAGTIWAVELLRRELTQLGRSLMAFELDWLLWSGAQGRELRHPYHRTRTVFY
jgi:hypothetical protein